MISCGRKQPEIVWAAIKISYFEKLNDLITILVNVWPPTHSSFRPRKTLGGVEGGQLTSLLSFKVQSTTMTHSRVPNHSVNEVCAVPSSEADLARLSRLRIVNVSSEPTSLDACQLLFRTLPHCRLVNILARLWFSKGVKYDCDNENFHRGDKMVKEWSQIIFGFFRTPILQCGCWPHFFPLKDTCCWRAPKPPPTSRGARSPQTWPQSSGGVPTTVKCYHFLVRIKILISPINYMHFPQFYLGFTLNI